MPVGCAVMKTAVPGTRTGCAADTMAMNSSSGIARAVSRSATNRRPVFHVVINVNSAAATASVTQPPCITFSALAPKNETSMIRNTATTPIANAFRQCHTSVITTYSSMTVMIIVSVTAMP